MRFLTFIWLIGFTSSYGQTRYRVTAESQYGFIISHAADLKPASQYNPVGVVINWQAMQTCPKNWEVCNCFHYLGLQLAFTHFGNRNILGSAWTIAGTFEPVLWQRNKWLMSLKTGLGISYLTQVHHPETNPLNNFFSAPISFLMFVAPALEYRFVGQWGATLSFNYNHISNGGQKQPNRGINYPQAGLGLSYYLKPHTQLPHYEKKTPEKTWHFLAETGSTTRKTGVGDARRPALSMAGLARKQLGFINALGGGAELTNDWSVAKSDGLTVAPFVSHHFLLGRFDFSQRMAVYMQRPASVNHSFYQRYLLYFKMRNSIILGFSLKGHGHIADNMDLRIGWLF